MLNLNTYIKQIAGEYSITDNNFSLEFTRYLVNNNWFGLEPEIRNRTIFIDERIKNYIDTFCKFYGSSTSQKLTKIMSRLKETLPETASDFKKYCEKKKIDEDTQYVITDFLLYFFAGELYMADDTEMGYYMEEAFDTLTKTNGDVFADFVNWTKKHRKKKVAYRSDYFMNNRTKHDTSAYSPTEYLRIIYYLFNASYIADHKMYKKAAESKNYADTWLFLSLHFICALRNTDLVRITHPTLTDNPENVLKQISNGSFTDTDARMTLYSIIWRLNALMLKPHKTKKHEVASIKLHIPESAETHFGRLFAIAEAHYQITDSEGPLIRTITTYQQISRYMGEEIGDLFLTSNFKSLSANKSFMQMIKMMTDDILGGNDEFNTKGYILASLARSHKGSYGDFAKTTVTYLRDAKMSGYTPEFVAKELFERGVLSFMPSMMLKILTSGEYNKLSPENQTALIRRFNMTPLEIERTVSLAQDLEKRSADVVQKIYSISSRTEMLEILHRIGNGEAVSKQDECLCMITAMKHFCPYPDRRNCIGCQYEISTKSTFFMMATEFERLKDLYRSTKNPVNKNKYKETLFNIVAPAMSEMLECLGETYGEEVKSSLEEILDRMDHD